MRARRTRARRSAPCSTDALDDPLGPAWAIGAGPTSSPVAERSATETWIRLHSAGVALATRTKCAATLVRLVALATVLAGLTWVCTAPSTAASSALVRPSALAPGSAPAGSTALGSVPGRQQLELSVVLPPSNRGRLQSLLADLYNPHSTDYHEWLGPGQFAREFGPSAAEVGAVESWLHGAGLVSTSVSGLTVKVVATETHVASALGTAFEQYRDPSGHVGYLARQAPLVPSTLAGGQIQAILGLDTVAHFAPESSVAPAAPGGASLAPNADGLTPCAAAQTAASSSYYTFDAIGAAYGLGALLADGQDGNGETIAVYELASHSPADVATYESCFGLTNPITTTPVDGGGGTVGGDGTIEADADIEEAATEAPGASIISYEGPNTTATGAYDTWNKIITQDKAQVVTTSWGVCEPLAVTGNEIPSFTALFEQAATQGQTVLAAAGDSGSEGCYPNSSSTLEEVDYPASDVWVTAVGGTSRYSNGTETAWNDCQTTESTACAASHTDQAAGGGGQSR